MLGIGMQEIILILLVALVVIGPKRLPEVARTLGKGLAEFRKATEDFQESIRKDIQEEKHEEFVKKYPYLEDGDKASETTPRKEGQAAPEDPPADTEPEPTYKPEEIEGGVQPEKESRDG
ncbi:MAG: twin-arginine translocase subunit TatB [Proteobacteria bacterium]|nr:twin-arginine translocase subunit TatB [Pseudomonadota bacterium]